ncbi:MAG: tyrosine-protein phosphatase [Chromatiales bacterium]|nr:tyrosine-protein phosphatase [Chromatiales bacterium]
MNRFVCVLPRHLAFWGFLILGVVGGFFLHLQVSGNLYPLIEGQYYRSAQLAPARLETVVVNQGIRSILNLRGAQPGEEWYDAEVALAERLHVAHYDVRLSARRAVPAEKIESILALLRQAPKPVLIHCQAGADRTGLIAAVLRLQQGDPPSRARRQLGLRYGHFPWLGNATVAMDQSFEAYLHTKGAIEP